MKIIKRNGCEVPYDCEKIRAAITAANDEMDSDDRISNIGIRLVNGISKDVQYQNLLGLNVLTIRI